MSYISPPSSKNSGFSLVELLVTIVIVTIILSVILFNQSTYTDAISLNNDAGEMSLRLFEAQAYGRGVRETSPGSGVFDSPYGLSISLLADPRGSDSSYIFFVSKDTNASYAGDLTCAPDAECIEKVNLLGSNRITSICLIRVAVPDWCNVGRVDITFRRPSTTAIIVFFFMGGEPFNPPGVKGARINLTNQDGDMRSVAIYTTGQISLE